MKRNLAIFFAILSLSIFFNIEKDCEHTYNDIIINQSAGENIKQSFSQGDNYIDLNGRQGSSSSISVTKLVVRSTTTRRNILDIFSGVRIAIANLYSEFSYSHSCDFPFEHQPQKELFFILRNIRI